MQSRVVWGLLPSSLVYDACGLERELGAARGAADRVAEEGGAEPGGRVGNLRALFCAAFDAEAPIVGNGGVWRWCGLNAQGRVGDGEVLQLLKLNLFAVSSSAGKLRPASKTLTLLAKKNKPSPKACNSVNFEDRHGPGRMSREANRRSRPCIRGPARRRPKRSEALPRSSYRSRRSSPSRLPAPLRSVNQRHRHRPCLADVSRDGIFSVQRQVSQSVKHYHWVFSFLYLLAAG